MALPFGWAVGNLGTILHTSDGGTTWGPQTIGTVAVFLFGVDFVETVAVPEPSTLAPLASTLAALGLAALCRRRRRP